MVFVASLVVLAVGASLGLLGRVVVRRDLNLAPRLLARDDEVWWEVGGGVLGAAAGYIGGRFVDSYTPLGATPLRWYLMVVGAIVIIGIAIASGAIERARERRGARR